MVIVFFRAISSLWLVYGSDEYHLMVRRQAVERVSDYPEDYQDYFLCDYASVEDYVYQMARNSYWADNAIIRATADALEIQIHVISSTNEYIPTFNPDSGNPSQTVFLGHIEELHYVSTASAHEPQCLLYGGTTSDGVQLSRTEAIDTSLTWFFNMMYNHENCLLSTLQNSKNKDMEMLYSCYQLFKKGNSADGKLKWYAHRRGKKGNAKFQWKKKLMPVFWQMSWKHLFLECAI